MTPAATERATDLISRLPAGGVVGAEIGVWRGYMSAALLFLRRDLKLLMVDNWKGDDESPNGYRTKDMPENRQIAIAQTRFAGERCYIVEGDSTVAANTVPDKSLDFVFIDADHSYEAVKADIASWIGKLKPGGLLAGHDYANRDSEVHLAVDEAAQAHGWLVSHGKQTCWYVTV